MVWDYIACKTSEECVKHLKMPLKLVSHWIIQINVMCACGTNTLRLNEDKFHCGCFQWAPFICALSHFNEIILKEKKIHLEVVRLLFSRFDEWKSYVHIKSHDNGTRHTKTLNIENERGSPLTRTKRKDDTYVRKLMHIVAVIYNLNTRLLMATSATISKCVYVYAFNVKILLCFIN